MRVTVEIHLGGSVSGWWKINRYDDSFGVNVHGYHVRLRPITVEVVVKNAVKR